MSGYPESYLDIRSAATVSIIESMIAQQCKAKASTPSRPTSTRATATRPASPHPGHRGALHDHPGQLHALDRARVVHQEPDDTGDSYAADMEPLADAVLTEQCNEYSSCSLLSAYEGHKAVFNAEYNLSTANFCPADNAAGFNGALFPSTSPGRGALSLIRG